MLCCGLLTLAGNRRLAKRVPCEEMIAEDMVMGNWVLKTRDESASTHTVEDVGLFVVDLTSEAIDSSLIVDDAGLGEVVFGKPEDG